MEPLARGEVEPQHLLAELLVEPQGVRLHPGVAHEVGAEPGAVDDRVEQGDGDGAQVVDRRRRRRRRGRRRGRRRARGRLPGPAARPWTRRTSRCWRRRRRVERPGRGRSGPASPDSSSSATASVSTASSECDARDARGDDEPRARARVARPVARVAMAPSHHTRRSAACLSSNIVLFYRTAFDDRTAFESRRMP